MWLVASVDLLREKNTISRLVTGEYFTRQNAGGQIGRQYFASQHPNTL
jgi:hypothetical protein